MSYVISASGPRVEAMGPGVMKLCTFVRAVIWRARRCVLRILAPTRMLDEAARSRAYGARDGGGHRKLITIVMKSYRVFGGLGFWV